jgi:CHAT domain-containing protein
MKRTLLAILLCSQSLWADPLSTSFQRLDWPGAHPSVTQRAQILDQAESTFRQQHDGAGLVRVECLRLEPLLNAYDPSCPERMKKLEKAAAGLAPGPVRAQYYWVRSVYAGLRQDDKTRDEFQKLAFEEPGVEAVERARWLLRIAKEQNMTKSKHQWVEAQRRQLGAAEAEPQLRYLVLGLQQQMAKDSGDRELYLSLGLSQCELASREHWGLEEVESNLLLQIHSLQTGADVEKFWKRAWAVAQREKSDELRLRVLQSSPTVELLKTGLVQLAKPVTEDTKRELLLKSQISRQLDDGLVVEEWRQQADYYRRLGDLPKEISARASLAYALQSVKRFGESLQQQQSAYDLSLQLTIARSGWVPSSIRPVRIAIGLGDLLRASNRIHQCHGVMEGLLKTGSSLLPEDEYQVRRWLLVGANKSGDSKLLAQEWTAIARLVDTLPLASQSNALFDLYRFAPPTYVPQKGELLKRAKEVGERECQEAWTWIDRIRASRTLCDCLREGKDYVGLRIQLKQMFDSALSENERRELARTLADEYKRAGLVDEYKQFVIGLLKSREGEARRDFLMDCLWLAEKKDPLALAWAEELLRLPSSQAGPSRNRALLTRAGVMHKFERYQEALVSLDQVDLTKALDSSRLACAYALQRAQVLVGLGRKSEAVTTLRSELQRLLNSQEPQSAATHFDGLIRLELELGLDWQTTLETASQRYQSLGESGRVALSEVVYVWLNQLVGLKEWDKGRQLLTKYPWKLGASHSKTKKLREYEEWKDLLPAAENAVTEPGQVGSTPKEAQSVRELVDQLRLNQPQLGELLSLRSTNLKYLQERLGPKETLVTYCSDGDQFYTIALRNKTSFFKRSQVSSRDLESLREKYLKALNSDKPSDSEASLFSTLLEPVLTEDPGQRILVVPTGTLWQLPFGALRDPKGRAVASRSDIVLLTSGDLLRLADNSWSPYRLSQPLAIGAPPAADLPGAFRELGEVAGALPNCELRRGDQATMASLYDSSRHWGLVHFASHAHYHQDRPLESDIQLHDGILKIRQLSQLSLAEHALVTLSVCQGGDSAGQRLSEPVSLATGFSASGAETVVANLWPVEDEVARVFFGEFYKQLGQGDSPMKSFRQAQDKVRAKFPKPEDWAGFFLMGNPT